MQVKGTAVKPTLEYVKTKFPDRFDEWFEALSQESKEIFNSTITATNWYPIKEAYIEPTKLVGELFFDNIYNAAFQLGIHSANIGLQGIYKVFIRIATPKFILGRGLNMFSSYFKPSNVKIDIQNKSLFHFYIYQFTEADKIAMHRVSGWMHQALVLIKQNNINLEVTSFEEEGKTIYKIICSWE